MPVNAGLLTHVSKFVAGSLPDASEERVCEWIDIGTKAIASRYWCLDPIDGTKGFLRKEQYAVALALIVEGVVQLGVLACPNLFNDRLHPEDSQGVLFWAVRGNGAFQKSMAAGERNAIGVSPALPGGEIRFCESVEPGHADHEAHSQVAKRLGITAPSIRMDSQAKYGIVARGDASIYLRLPNPKTPDYREKVWDHAAGSILIEEAGGKVTDVNGRSLDFGVGYKLVQNRGVVATNGVIHEAVLAALQP
jgi:3'(2'), 5'-bisphosphate nucleotidase